MARRVAVVLIVMTIVVGEVMAAVATMTLTVDPPAMMTASVVPMADVEVGAVETTMDVALTAMLLPAVMTATAAAVVMIVVGAVNTTVENQAAMEALPLMVIQLLRKMLGNRTEVESLMIELTIGTLVVRLRSADLCRCRAQIIRLPATICGLGNGSISQDRRWTFACFHKFLFAVASAQIVMERRSAQSLASFDMEASTCTLSRRFGGKRTDLMGSISASSDDPYY